MRLLVGDVGRPLSGGGKATHIAMSRNSDDAPPFTCTILSDQSVKCWGHNEHGKTGRRGRPLSGGEKATHIALGEKHGCVILSNKTIKCWGLYRNHGQL